MTPEANIGLYPGHSARRLCCLLLSLLMSAAAAAGARPGTEDAACDGIDLRYRTGEQRINERELNFLLFDAAAQGCLALVTSLLGRGAAVEARDRFGNTPLLIAARMGHLDVLDLLLEKNADPHRLNLAGSSALLRAVTTNRRRIVERLLELGVDPNIGNTRGINPLITAAYNGNQRIVELLLKHKADPSAVDDSGKGAAVYAAGRGYLGILKLLVDSPGFNINARYGNALTLLMWSAGHSNDVPEKEGLLSVEYLLSQNAAIDLVDNRGRTALMIAAERGHRAIVERLLKEGPQDLSDNEGLRAVDLAADPAIQELLRKSWP